MRFDGKRYEFLTAEQAIGFARFLEQGKMLEHACRTWKPKRILAADPCAIPAPRGGD